MSEENNFNKITQEIFENKIKEFIEINIEINSELNIDETISRNYSWNILHDFFKENDFDENKIELISLNIGMFLASWGMYRGSSKISKYFNYRIHNEITKILIKKEYHKLISINDIETYINEIKNIKKLYYEIEKKYSSIFNSNKTKLNTLVSKILLGTYGCSIAYDTYVIEGIKKLKRDNGLEVKNIFSIESLEKIFIYFKEIEIDFKSILKSKEFKKYNFTIPKLIDMFLFMHGKEH